MNHKSLFFAIISAVLLTTACEKNKGGEEIPEPVPVMDIDVQVNVLTDFTAGVTLIPESADNEYFACILPKEEYYTDSAESWKCPPLPNTLSSASPAMPMSSSPTLKKILTT